MNLWLLQKKLEMLHIPAEGVRTYQIQTCRAVTDSFSRGELAAHEAVAMITGIIQPY